jgi:uncharacterized protein YlbG (UPF0298 family)
MENIERILKAFANKRRIVIVQYLKNEKRRRLVKLRGRYTFHSKQLQNILICLLEQG